MGELRIIGTSHISEQSAKDIERAFDVFKPDIVAIELDKRRLDTLLSRKKGERIEVPFSIAKQIGVTGWLFLRIGGWLQRKLGSIVDVEPGADMLRAVELAREREVKVALVDRDVLITLKRIRLSGREKLRLIKDIITGPFKREKVNFDLTRVPSQALIRKLMGMLKERYPGIYIPLVEERNQHMASRIKGIVAAHPESKILLVIGAGHEDGVRELLADHRL